MESRSTYGSEEIMKILEKSRTWLTLARWAIREICLYVEWGYNNKGPEVDNVMLAVDEATTSPCKGK